jgi:hypothetical protein
MNKDNFVIFAANSRKGKLRARILPRIREKTKLFLDVHQGPIMSGFMKKTDTKNPMLQPH